ncbi:MAG: hypothetical protein DMF68_03110 [Acidobacteria bacterium]|nr:MAG: hypothetical protein DMF68_03110 [Acidobacteriota bacterium]
MRQHQIIKAIVLALLFIATLNLGAQFYREYRQELELQRLQEEHPGITVCRLGGPPIDVSSRLYIELALVAAFIGIGLKRFQSKLFYFVGLIGVAVTYFFWWKYHFRIAENAGIRIGWGNHIAYLNEANYWDICIAVSIALLLLWEFSCAILSLFRTNSSTTLNSNRSDATSSSEKQG